MFGWNAQSSRIHSYQTKRTESGQAEKEGWMSRERGRAGEDEEREERGWAGEREERAGVQGLLGPGGSASVERFSARGLGRTVRETDGSGGGGYRASRRRAIARGPISIGISSREVGKYYGPERGESRIGAMYGRAAVHGYIYIQCWVWRSASPAQRGPLRWGWRALVDHGGEADPGGSTLECSEPGWLRWR